MSRGDRAAGASAQASPPLTCQREAFSLPRELRYLNCAYQAPLPRVTEAAVIAGLRRKRVPSDITPDDFFSDGEEVRRRFAELVGGDPDRVALLPSVSYGVATAAQNLPGEAGQNLVVVAEQFPSNVYAWRRMAGERGLVVRTVGAPSGPDRGRRWNERLLEAVDEATAMVAMPTVHWTDGTRFDVAGVAARAKETGASLLVDGTQSVGALPLDLSEVQPDVLVTAGYKWMLAPYSTALAHFGPRLDEGTPLEETWTAREGSHDFQHLVDYREAYRPGARRFDVGESANFALLPGLLASLELVLEWGPARVQRYCDRLTRELIAVAIDRGFEVEDPEWRGHHLFGIRMRNDGSLERLEERLREARISVSLRGSALRVSPNAYNDEADVGALTEVLAAT